MKLIRKKVESGNINPISPHKSWNAPGIVLESKVLGHLYKVMNESINVPNKTSFLLKRVHGKSVLDVGCVGHSLAISEKQKEHWLHAQISRSASYCLGVDLLKAETEALRSQGWNLICIDFTKVDLGKKFDVIVAADLIEHLVDFDGFFRSVARHIADNGELVISTPNPLGFSQFFYTGLRGSPLVNPDHTCWFDPKTLIQLAGRYGFVPESLAWVRNSWKPSYFLLHGLGRFGLSDFFTGFWSPAPTWLRWARGILQQVILAPLNWIPRLLSIRKYWGSDFILVLKKSAK